VWQLVSTAVVVVLVQMLLVISPAGAAFSVELGFTNITNNNPTDAANGEAQLAVEAVCPVNGNTNQVSFTFTNTGTAAMSITDVYFEDGTLLGIASITDGTGVDFEQNASPGDLPGGNNATPPFSATAGFTADSEPPTQPNGVNPGETLTIVFDLQAGLDCDDVLSALNLGGADGGLRIGIHVQGFAGGGSESFVNGPPPSPTDDTPPTCPVGKIRSGIDANGIKYAEVDLQDAGSGVVSIVQSPNAKNVTLSYKIAGDSGLTAFDPTSPPSVTFSPAVTDLITVRGTKIDNSKGSRLEIIVTDAAGNVTVCDPVEEVVIQDSGKPYTATHSNVLGTMTNVTVVNNNPGINSVVLTVNGTKVTVKNLKPSEVRRVDISSAMHEGSNNTISLKATGGTGSSATIYIAEEWVR